MQEPDRIAQPWGERTPYGRDESWSARVDQHLAGGVTPEDVQRWAKTASLLHSNGDAMDIAVVDGRIAGVRGRADDRVNRGRLGPKDLFGWQANASPDRLTRPLVRMGGRLVETDWDTAMGRVVAQSKGNGWVDREYIDAHAVGFAELEKRVGDYPPEHVAAICRIEPEQIRAAARVLGRAERLLSTVLQGFYQSHQATAAAVQVNNVNLIRGMLGRPGCGSCR